MNEDDKDALYDALRRVMLDLETGYAPSEQDAAETIRLLNAARAVT